MTRSERRADTRTWPAAADGVVLVDKPAGWTSHDVVGKIRYLARTRKVGHAGTLDPMATGVLVVGVGRATRLLTYIVGADKEYTATIRLGVSTTSDDAQGEVVAVADAADVTDAQVHEGVHALTGDILQVPSTVSAIKVDGRRAYALARAGEEVELQARPVTVSRFDVHDVRRTSLDAPAEPEGATSTTVLDVDVTVVCSSGTYIRALARDLGAALGVGGHLTALRRTRVGGYRGGATVDELVAHVVDGDAALPLVPLADAARAVMPVRDADADEVVEILHGRRIARRGEADGPVGVVGPDGTLVAVGETVGEQVRPVAVLGTVPVGRADGPGVPPAAGDARGQE